TADRSVEALDTALRRRFSFVPMAPKPEELKITADDINLPEILRVLNNRLSVLKDSDHTLGHAWLWNVSDLNSLKIVFRDKILPLLQEYFYNDYEKLGLVLGDAFFQKHEQINSNIFAPFTGGNGLASQYDQIWKYKLKSVDALTIEDFKSLEQLYNMTGIQ
ncbi:MAG TPA: ATPase, partial [Saprospiraceae bacterium]|nr:ATPase [Saprospiraceae bacterium]